MHTPLELFDSATARQLDVRASAVLGDGYALMQRAGQAAWQYVLAQWPQARRIEVVCGPGNNGGDGYVLAALALRSGRAVRVLRLPGDAPRSTLAQHACADYQAAGGQVVEAAEVDAQADVIVDALYGLGFDRAPVGDAAALIASIDRAQRPVLALDVPSGVDADRGHVPGVAVRADATLQFIVAHRGLYTGQALEHVGRCCVADLQVPALLPLPAGGAQQWRGGRLVDALPKRRLNTHKGESGHVCVIGGNDGSGGALIFSVQAALRAGAGLVSALTRAAHVTALLARCPEAMVHAVEEVEAIAPVLARASVVAVGPGLGQDVWAQSLLAAAVAAGKPLVIDADALNLLVMQPALRLPPFTVLTPHPGEAARMLGVSTSEIQADRFGAVRALVGRFPAVTVLKGAGTLVAGAEGPVRVIAAGNPGMAVGGMGDLLTGVIAALLAQGHNALDAAADGALLHGLAGDAAAADGERGLLPSDLLPHLRRLANP